MTAIAPSGSWWFEGFGLVDGEVCGSPVGGDFGSAMIDGGRVTSNDVKTAASINDGTYHAVIVTRSTADDTVKTYIDGQLQTSWKIIPTDLTGMPWIGVGNNPCNASVGRLYFPGEIDELRFYNRVIQASEIAELSGQPDVDVQREAASRTAFTSAFPNPTRGMVTMTFVLAQTLDTRLEVYDLRGGRVRTLASGRWPAGQHAVRWSGDDDQDRPVRPGVYLVHFKAGSAEQRRKLVRIQ